MENIPVANNQDGICGAKRTVDDISSLQPLDRSVIFPPRIPKETSPRKRRRVSVLKDEKTVSHSADHQVPPPVAPASLDPSGSETSVATVNPPTSSGPVRTQLFSFPSGDRNLWSGPTVNQGSAMNTTVPTTALEDEKMPSIAPLIAPHNAFPAEDTTNNQVEKEICRFIPHAVSKSDDSTPPVVGGSASTTTSLRQTDLGFGIDRTETVARRYGASSETSPRDFAGASEAVTEHTSHQTTTLQLTGFELGRKETSSTAQRFGHSETFRSRARLSPIAEGSEAVMDNIPETYHQSRDGGPQFGGSSPSGFLSSVSSIGSSHGSASSVSSTERATFPDWEMLCNDRIDDDLFSLLDTMESLPRRTFDPRDLEDEDCKQALARGVSWTSPRNHKTVYKPSRIKFVEKDKRTNRFGAIYKGKINKVEGWHPIDPLGRKGMKSAAKHLAVSLFDKGKKPQGGEWTLSSLKNVDSFGLKRRWPKYYFIRNSYFQGQLNKFYNRQANAELGRESEQRRARSNSESSEDLAIAQDQTESSQDPLNVVVTMASKFLEADERHSKERKEIEERNYKERKEIEERNSKERMHLVSETNETQRVQSIEKTKLLDHVDTQAKQASKERVHMLSKTAEIVKQVTTTQRNAPTASESFSSFGEDAPTGMDTEVQDSGESRAEVELRIGHSLSREDSDETATND